MINLLPDTAKKELHASRTNVMLLNYILMSGMGVAFLAVICAGAYLILSSTQASAEELIKDNQSKSTSFSSVQAQGDALRASLSNAKIILDQEVLYSKVVTGIAALMPPGVILDSLSLSPATFSSPTNLQIYAKSDSVALALKDSLQNSPLFSNISFQSLSNNGQSDAYPVSATLSLIINKSAAR
jgi:hypothetical protein